MIYDMADGVFSNLRCNRSPPLGILENAGYSAIHGKLLPGHLIAIGTDGIWEAMSTRGEMFGKERVCRIIRERAAHGADAIVRSVFDELNDLTGKKRLEDDGALVIAKVG